MQGHVLHIQLVWSGVGAPRAQLQEKTGFVHVRTWMEMEHGKVETESAQEDSANELCAEESGGVGRPAGN